MAAILDTSANLDDALARALDELARGEPVAIPTETVYGLAADATNPKAIARIYEIKGRPRFNPLICHVADMEMAERYAEFSPLAVRLGKAFWPGPLTLVLPARENGVHELATAGLTTVGIRVPRSIAGELIARYGKPLAAPSANTSGKISPTSAQHVADDLGSKLGVILDAGDCGVGVESTIIKVEGDRLILLRPGGVAVEDIETATGCTVERGADHAAAIEAPGMLASHYAPGAAMRLAADRVNAGEALINFGGQAIDNAGEATFSFDLSPSGDLREAAANLFSMMKQADATGAKTIAVAPIPMAGLGEAINDRLMRAAAPRP
ncbi:L-threonylcarbamoyladenylate synthase [Rhizobium sp. L1K21]|uniref:L-threonylcarbamoyladenylate synthase n=1 Tax=Rhizobium sp. L1K21 TaxID=2954933 RepID=UPI0020933BE7|nr:L-threonylcarbamoyladenylate synthase [Rhizobium sp. L1K21]MCO6186893.1 L-threonylcarbamoyladenylate synthase [Rhizobium sp. L1K21]